MAIEIWLPVKGFEGSYEVSNLGQVRSLDRTIVRSDGKTMSFKGRMYLPQKDKNGYLILGLRIARQPKYVAKVHRLVAIAFIPNPEGKPHVNHLDGVKTNNVVENLEWATNLENNVHAVAAGLMVYRRGEEHMNAKVAPEVVRQVRALRELGHSYGQISKVVGIKEQHAWKIGTKRLWKHLA
jgi:hypothetical protein